MSEYISTVESAKMMRKALKKAFPNTKFSVRSQSYSMGSHVNVHWTNGPTVSQVETIVGAYCGKSFDGMIDMSYSMNSWLLPDGTVTFASTEGTTGSMGTVSPANTDKPHPDAKLVHFIGSGPSCSREVTDEAIEGVKMAFARLSEDDRFKLMQATDAERSLSPYQRPDSYHLDASLTDFGQHASEVFRNMAYALYL